MISATSLVVEGAGHLGLARHAGPAAAAAAAAAHAAHAAHTAAAAAPLPHAQPPPPAAPHAVQLAFGDSFLLPAAPKAPPGYHHDDGRRVRLLWPEAMGVGGGGGGGCVPSKRRYSHAAPAPAPAPAPSTQVSEPFLRPLPKPAPMLPPARGGVGVGGGYNGATAHALNGCRVVPTQLGPRVCAKYQEPSSASPAPPAASAAVNLAAHHKAAEAEPEEAVAGPPPPPPPSAPPGAYAPRLFPPPPPPPAAYYPGLQGPYGSLYPAHYSPMLSRAYVPAPPPAPAPAPAPPPPPSTGAAFLAAYSPPAPAPAPAPSPHAPDAVKPGQSVLRERRAFKVPSGKEGSLKHRILTRPSPAAAAAVPAPCPSPAGVGAGAEAEVEAAFARGALIRLESGEVRRVEELRTEDFVCSAERSPLLRLAPSTVVRIAHPHAGASGGGGGGGVGGGGGGAGAARPPTAQLTLSLGDERAQVRVEAALDRPFFVYGHGWASLAPERTLLSYGLLCARLQVGDVCVSVRPRTPPPTAPPPPTPPAPAPSPAPSSSPAPAPAPAAGPPRKRRWSAPDHIHKAEEAAAAAAAAVAAASAARRPKHEPR